MKILFFGLSALLLLLLMACNKEPMPTTTQPSLSKTSIPIDADVVYHYRGVAYPLYFQEDSKDAFVEDATYTALQSAVGDGVSEFFKFSDYPSHYTFLFDNEWEAYDFIEKNSDAYVGRRYKLALRIEELRDQLANDYGYPLDYNNASLVADARAGIQAMYEELKVNSSFPRDLAAFIGRSGRSFTPHGNGRSLPVLTMYEHDNLNGQHIDVETAPHTTVWTYGDHDCYTMATNSDLTLEVKPDGSNWSDCISSQYFRYVQGARAMMIGRYKDHHFAEYGCAYMRYEYRDYYFTNTCCESSNMRDTPWGGFLCRHQNDQITSIKIKAVWDQCPIDFSDV